MDCYRPGYMHYPYNSEFKLDFEDDWNTLSIYEKLCYIKDYFQKHEDQLDEIRSVLALKEDSLNITLNRLLSEDGDFTGTLAGEKTALELIQFVEGNRDQIQYIASQFSNGQTGFVIDGGFFEETGIKANYNGGYF